jgi:acyl-CoA thioesterase
MSFDRVTRVVDGVWNVPEGWRQGRGAFGGLTLATLARAASEHAGDRALRTITAEIPSAVVVGPAQMNVTPLRVGSGLSTIAAHLSQNGEVVAHAVASFGKTRVTDFDRAEKLSLAPFTNTPSVPMSSGGPEFFQNVECRIVRGMPFASEKDAITEGWIRLLEPGDVPRWVALVGLVDAWFPSAMPVMSAPRPFATISFAAHLFEREWSLAEPLFHRSRLVGSQEGYFVELRELFTPRGELCAVNQQTFAIIK